MMSFKSTQPAAWLLCATLFGATHATADTWWETEDGSLYWDGEHQGMAVLRFIENGQIDQASALFIDAMGPLYYTDGALEGNWAGGWVQYFGNEESCGWEGTDPWGKPVPYWGSLTVTFKDDDNFTMQFMACEDQKVIHTLNGTEGKPNP